jgi:hypothetical protein
MEGISTMGFTPDQEAIIEMTRFGAWMACNPDVSTPADVEEMGILAIRDLNQSLEDQNAFDAAISCAIINSVHQAMVIRGMFLDATDLFSRLNAALQPLGIDVLNGKSYTEYVDGLLAH